MKMQRDSMEPAKNSPLQFASSRVSGSEAQTGSGIRRELVQVAAYYRAEKRGFVGGDPAQDWFEAERDVDRMLRSPAGSKAYLERINMLLDQWDKSFEGLKDKASAFKTGIQAKYKKELDAIAGKRVALGKQLEELQRQSGEAWSDLREGAEKAWSEILTATQKVASRFNEEDTASERKEK